MLGPKNFKMYEKSYHRKDYEITSSEKHKLKCSFIEPTQKYRSSKIMPLVIYLHGNSSSRVDGYYVSHYLLRRGINVFLFDFAGCGKSEGEFISLGYHESNDIKIIIDYITNNIEGVGNIGLWGRSMGAATTMIYAHRDKRVKAICMDSPFADFEKLARELTLQQISLPGFLISIALSIIATTVKSKNGLDIYKLKPIEHAKKTKIPAFFIHAKNDELINVQHSEDLFKEYVGKKKFIIKLETGGHNSGRGKIINNDIAEFFEKYLLKNDNDNNLNISNKKNIARHKSVDIKKVITTESSNKETKFPQKRKQSIIKGIDKDENIIDDDDLPIEFEKIEKCNYVMRKRKENEENYNRMTKIMKSIKPSDFKNSMGNNMMQNLFNFNLMNNIMFNNNMMMNNFMFNNMMMMNNNFNNNFMMMKNFNNMMCNNINNNYMNNNEAKSQRNNNNFVNNMMNNLMMGNNIIILLLNYSIFTFNFNTAFDKFKKSSIFIILSSNILKIRLKICYLEIKNISLF